MEHILDNDEAYAIVYRLLDALPSGSYLAMSDPIGGKVMAEAIPALERERHAPNHCPQPPGVCALLRRLGTAGARRGLSFAVAA
jgi:hypothetical protein